MRRQPLTPLPEAVRRVTRRYLWLVALVFTPIGVFCVAEIVGLAFATSVRRTLGGWYFGLSFMPVVAATAPAMW